MRKTQVCSRDKGLCQVDHLISYGKFYTTKKKHAHQTLKSSSATATPVNLPQNINIYTQTILVF